jgi:16S rRNA G527 N7-methylase RsmG
MKQNHESFCSELFKYNKVHRLIGNVSCETLVKESLASFRTSKDILATYDGDATSGGVMVDIGAGAGILGYAWLKSGVNRRVIFVEPDNKAVAFLRGYFSKEPRAKVIQKKLDDLTLKDISSFEENKERIFLAARAFSSNKSIEECYQASGLDLPLYVFRKNFDVFSLERII